MSDTMVYFLSPCYYVLTTNNIYSVFDLTPSNHPIINNKDLLNFLESAGPLERTVDKSRTSPKVYESLLEHEEEERQKKQANQRTRRNMLMVEQKQHHMPNGGGEVIRGGGDDLDLESEQIKAGLTTTRTTSFSTAVPKEADTAELKMTDIDLFRFLAQVRDNESTPEDYLQRNFTDGTGHTHDGNKNKHGAGTTVLPLVTEEEMQTNLIWLQDLCKYNSVPVLLQDTDESLIGAWAHNVEDLERQKIHPASNGATLAIQNELDKLLGDRGKNIPQIK